jgi:hypothetical protein
VLCLPRAYSQSPLTVLTPAVDIAPLVAVAAAQVQPTFSLTDYDHSDVRTLGYDGSARHNLA